MKRAICLVFVYLLTGLTALVYPQHHTVNQKGHEQMRQRIASDLKARLRGRMPEEALNRLIKEEQGRQKAMEAQMQEEIAQVCASLAVLPQPGQYKKLEAAAAVNAQDSLALVALYNSAGGAAWTHQEQWLSGPVASWYGVTVEGDRVTALALRNNNLSGPLPSEIGQLTALKELWLDNNRISGSLPASLGQLSQLRLLIMHYNNLTGCIPAAIGDLGSLESLYLSYNQ